MLIFNPQAEKKAADGGYFAAIAVKSLDARAKEVSPEHSAEIDAACTNAVDGNGQGSLYVWM